MKIRPVGIELFHADGRTNGQVDRQTDTTKLIVAFRNFENVPKNKIEKMCILINAETPENTNVP